MLTRAVARATIWFDDPLIGWPSIPMTVRHGRNHSRSCRVTPGSPVELHARAHAERAREPLGRVVEARDRRPVPRRRFGQAVEAARERDVAVLVDQRREQPRQRHHRIGDRTARHARVLRSVERAQLDVGRGETAQ